MFDFTAKMGNRNVGLPDVLVDSGAVVRPICESQFVSDTCSDRCPKRPARALRDAPIDQA